MALAVTPGAAHAQAGWYLLPSLTLTEELDDNVLGGSRSRMADAISRASATLGAGYRSTPLTFIATGLATGEVFEAHPDLTGVNRKQARIDTSYREDQLLELRLQGVFTETQTPSELVGDLGLQLGRTNARQTAITPSASYQFDRTLSGEATYTFTTETTSAVTSSIHQGRVSLVEHATPVDDLTASYKITRGTSGGLAVASDAVTAGWTRRLFGTTTIGAEAGPRLSTSGLDFDANARLARRLENGQLTFSYSRSETTVVGHRGALTADTLVGLYALRPQRDLSMSLSSRIAHASGSGLDAMTYGADVSLSYEIAKRVAIVTQYRFTFQAARTGDVVRNVLSINLQISAPTRLY